MLDASLHSHGQFYKTLYLKSIIAHLCSETKPTSDISTPSEELSQLHHCTLNETLENQLSTTGMAPYSVAWAAGPTFGHRHKPGPSKHAGPSKTKSPLMQSCK